MPPMREIAGMERRQRNGHDETQARGSLDSETRDCGHRLATAEGYARRRQWCGNIGGNRTGGVGIHFAMREAPASALLGTGGQASAPRRHGAGPVRFLDGAPQRHDRLCQSGRRVERAAAEHLGGLPAGLGGGQVRGTLGRDVRVNSINHRNSDAATISNARDELAIVDGASTKRRFRNADLAAKAFNFGEQQFNGCHGWGP